MARHRSPRGRAHRRRGAHRSPSLPVPLRGAAVVAATGGALSLIAATVPPAPAGEPAAALQLAAEDPDERGSDDDRDDDRRRPSVEPVDLDEDDDEDADVDDDRDSDDDEDLESARRGAAAAERRQAEEAERARRAEAERRAREALRGDCDGLRDGGLGAVKAHVREAGGYLGCRFGKPVMLGVAGRGGPSDHPDGLAVDFMVNRATGDALAQCALENMDALGIKYVIWEQRINHGNGWRPMADRGGATANHFDHVHVSFERGRGTGDVQGC